MNTDIEFPTMPEKTVYIRAVSPDDLPDEIRTHAVDAPGEIYAIHDCEGAYLGIAPSRSLAFHVARAHEMAPVRSVSRT